MIKAILKGIFPPSFDNQFSGYSIALWVFYPFTALTLWRSQHHVFSEDGGAQTIATIPIDSFSIEASNTVVAVFALWGLSQLTIGLIYILACIRYRSMIPLLYLLASFEYFMRFAYIAAVKPIVTVGTAPGATINIPFTVILLALSVASAYRWQKSIKGIGL